MSDAALNLRARARLGTMLRGKYRLDAVLGTGGMAIVYRATHRNRAEFAIKMLRSELSDDEPVRSRFLREGYAANSVKHEGVVSVVDDDIAEDGSAFLVMELLDGMSVEEMLERAGGRLDPAIACAIAWQVLDVLAAAHSKGILHRDIKPANLFVTRSGRVKVLDFGIARVRDAAESGARSTTTTGTAFGTPAFMSPEQALGDTKGIDDKCDIWQVGATLFTMMTGAFVHEGENAQQILVRAATSAPRPLASVAPGVPAPIAAAVDAALAYHKAQRWPSAAAMRDGIATAARAAFGQLPSFGDLARFCAAFPERGTSLDAGGETRRAEVAAPAHVGATTAAAVSSDKRVVRSRVAWVVGGALVAFAGAAALAIVMHRPTATGQASATAVSATARPTAVVTTAPSTPIASGVDVNSLPIASSAPRVVQTAPKPTTKPTAAPTSPPSASAKPSCNPNFWVDGEGNKHFKPECFQ